MAFFLDSELFKDTINNIFVSNNTVNVDFFAFFYSEEF